MVAFANNGSNEPKPSAEVRLRMNAMRRDILTAIASIESVCHACRESIIDPDARVLHAAAAVDAMLGSFEILKLSQAAFASSPPELFSLSFGPMEPLAD